MENLAIFGDIIRDNLAQTGIKVQEFSRRVKVDENSIAKWLSREYFPTPASASKVADYLYCSIDYLFGLADEPSFIRRDKCDNTLFLERFEELLYENSITAYRIEKECGIKQTTVLKWRKGNNPSMESLIKLAEYFGYSIDYLAGRSDYR